MISRMKLSLIFLCLGSLSCTHMAPRTVANEAYSYAIKPRDVARMKEIQRIQKAAAAEAWPGFEAAPMRMIFVDENLQWAFNVDPLPSYYKAIEVPDDLKSIFRTAAVTESFRDEVGVKSTKVPDALYRTFSSAQTEQHFQHSIYFVKSLDDFHRSGDRMDAEEWVHISLHEIFHTFQDGFVNYTPEFVKRTSVSYKSTIREDNDHSALLGPELKLLAEAACAKTVEKVKLGLKKALALREKRWAFIEKKYGVSPRHWERFDAWAEGTAHYTEHKIMSRWSDYASKTELRNDPFFAGFSKYQSENEANWCARIAENKKRSYWYSIGFAYSLILDRLYPNWKNVPLNQELFLDGYLNSLAL